jgi:type IV pilus assembly protein PilP
MIKKIIIFNLILGLLIASPLMLGCGDKKAKPEKSSQTVSKKIEKPQKVVPPQAPAKEIGSADETTPADDEKTGQASKPLIVLADTRYNPEGRVDPFAPLFKEEPSATTAVTSKRVQERKIPMTPLEKVDLSQLQLKAIIRTAAGNKALVEEASGKGYVVSKGTYIGTRSGTVVSILKDRVIIEEENEDAIGNVTIQEKELKLQKPLGEE